MRLNSVTIKDKYPLPRIPDILDQLCGNTVFTTLDLKAGYWQLPVAMEDRPKTAFVCHRGQYQYNRLPFGLVNAPSQFQRVMTQILAPLIGRCVMVYIDDIIVYSRDHVSHTEDLNQVLQLLAEHNVTLKRSKCEFARASVDLLGFGISVAGIEPLPHKVEAIAELAAPTCIKDVRAILGMSGYYRLAIPSYAHLAEPLIRLTRKGVPFEWNEECESSFQALKQALISAPIMAYADPARPYRLYTDACDYAIGAILVQTDAEGTERPIHYLSHQLSEVQRRWATIEKEAYAIVYALKKLRPYLYGADFVILTDHKPLRSLFSARIENAKIQRWAVAIKEYAAPIEYRQGKHNVRADMLSRIKAPTLSVVGATRSSTRRMNTETLSDHEDMDNYEEPEEETDIDVRRAVLNDNRVGRARLLRLQKKNTKTVSYSDHSASTQRCRTHGAG